MPKTNLTNAPNPAIRFLRFEWDCYYPGGAESDLRGAYPTLEEATAAKTSSESAVVFDTWTGKKYSQDYDWLKRLDTWSEDKDTLVEHAKGGEWFPPNG